MKGKKAVKNNTKIENKRNYINCISCNYYCTFNIGRNFNKHANRRKWNIK